MIKEKYYHTRPFVEVTSKCIVSPDLMDYTSIDPRDYAIRTDPCPRLSICSLWDTEKKTVVFGYAICSPKDIFVKKTGNALAKKMAMEDPCVSYTVKNIEDVPRIFAQVTTALESDFLDLLYR